MKKLIATTLATSLVGLAAFGQGAINFANFVGAPANINQPFLESDGVTKVPTAGYQVSLLVGTSATSLSLVDTVGLAAPGYIGSKTETLAGIAAGTPIFYAVEIWNTAAGSTFALAKAAGQAGTANAYGEFVSPTASATPTAAPNPPGPLTGLGSISLNSGVPEPSTFALAGLGAAALLIFRRRK